ncbi:type I polyketide synthase [Streptantibioticus ferralitis]|uniref:SDR family NAD(P)-dependent oxidoreductase n=1 Tax=Streptantibioticus ferralitis TaxID=236510 RepID=A0ABT5Z1U2_9ACTN|nr:type I polyketide synthase [Streptantibioticus ferralitis]MDF2257733.1 SDR family NAD(P)-dependent oxidoreductase [Streptantibioticus ferralitis]
MNDLVEPIAVIGMAGRFPGAHNIEQYWQNLCEGRESIHFLADDELRAARVPAAAIADPDYVKAVALAPDVDKFDADFFGFTPREAAVCGPQIRLFVEAAHGALENAGYDPQRLTDVGVFGSAGVNRYADQAGPSHPGELRSASGMSIDVLNNPDYVATLTSYTLGLRGPSMSVQTACSSSMVATHLAVQALRNGECTLALAGGADVEFPLGHGHWWAPGSPLTRDGHCRPFDRAASGTIFGSGVGVVTLKRLEDAVADGDPIRAVIRSIAVNNDGSDKVGFSAPSVSGQAAAIVEAMMLAGVTPQQISYVEAHATGTPLGDPIEVAALHQAYRDLGHDGGETASCALASVKGNIGHLGHAAGTAALIKAVLSLENEQIPPSINVTDLNPKLGLEQSPFYVNDVLRRWDRVLGRPRMAAVNSLGIGGTNVHAVLEEAPARQPTTAEDRARIVVWSARTGQAERAYRARLADHLGRQNGEGFADTAATLQHGRSPHGVRAAVVASRPDQAAAALTGTANAPRVITGPGTARTPRPVTYVFPGQGSQHAGMAAGLHGSEAAFTRAFDECLDLLDTHGLTVRTTWLNATDDEQLQDTAIAQPLLFATGYALAQMWSAWGVTPHQLLGHSVGELTAATIAGVLDLPDAARLVAARAQAAAAAPPGGMLAVTAAAEALVPLLPEALQVAVVNGPRQTVVSGPEDVLQEFGVALAERGINARPVLTSHAFHSRSMAAAADCFEAAFSGVALRAPRIPVRSAMTGRLVTDEEATSPGFWAGQLAQPVLFGKAIDEALADQDQILLEVGPGRTLTSVAAQHPSVASGRSLALATLPHRGERRRDEWECALNAVGVLWTEGHTIDWDAVDQQRPVRRTAIPGYPYERVRHWLETPAPTEHGDARDTEAIVHAGADRSEPSRHDDTPPTADVSPFTTLAWVEDPRESVPADRRDEPALVLLPPDDGRALDLMAACQRAGLRVLPVRAGEAYEESASGFRVRLDETTDMDRLFTTLAGRGVCPRILVHASTMGPWEAPTTANAAHQLRETFHSALSLVQHAARRSGAQGAPHLLVVTDRSVDVTGGESTDPVKATLHGFARTLALEEPAAACRVIDLGANVPEDELVEEISRFDRSEILALRGSRRWIRTERPYTPKTAAAGQVLRRNGVYLITGGLGGLGLETAKGLARTGLRPRLVLVGRTAVPTGETWQQMLSDGDNTAIRLRDGLQELTAMGANVKTVAADVADPAAARRAVAEAVAAFGPVNGVFHLAGVPGDGMLHFRTAAEADAVFAPKVLGTLALAEALADQQPLDLFVAFSSTAALRGLRGSGDYAAANAFLDAWAGSPAPSSTRFLSINWPAWHTVGMAVPGMARSGPTPSGQRTWTTVLTPQTCPLLDEHRLRGDAVLPGTAFLDFVIRAFRSQVLGGEAGPVRLDEVAFLRPLLVREQRTMEIGFVPADGHWEFVVRSCDPAEPDGSFLTHAMGRATRGSAAGRTVDMAGLKARFAGPQPRPKPGIARQLFTWGPRWDNITEIRNADAGNEKLLRLGLPAEFAGEETEYEVHPALLDTATSFARTPEHDEPHIPFLYGSMTVHQPPVGESYSHVRLQESTAEGLLKADVDLLAPDGRILVEVTGFTMRRVDPHADLLEGHTGLQAEPGRTQNDPPPTDDVPATSVEGIAPEAGVRLLMDLLGSRTSNQVAVAHHRNGQPVHMTASAAAPAAPSQPSVASAVTAPPAGKTLSVEEELQTLWTGALGMPEIGLDDDFFDLGGSSLTAVELMTWIRDRFAVELSIATLFEYPTLRMLADHLHSLGAW